MSDHVIPKRVYHLVFATLLVLTFLTVEVAFYDFGLLNFWIALGIATFKATIVILFFMHVKYLPRLTALFVGIGFVFLAIMLVFFLADVATRDWQYQPDSSGISLFLPFL